MHEEILTEKKGDEKMATRRTFVKNAVTALALSGLADSVGADEHSVTHSNLLPVIQLGKLRVTRLILGGNPFSGNSHQSGKLSNEMLDYYTTAKIKETLEEAYRCGVNAFLGRADKHIMRVLNEYWDEGGSLKIWIAQTAPEYASMRKNIDQAVDFGASAVYIQGNQTDAAFVEGRRRQLIEWLEYIKSKNVVAGIASHRTDNLPVAQKEDFPVDFYMQCFYNLNVHENQYLPEDRDAAIACIQTLEKPVIGYKILAAGRNEPEAAFRFAFSHIRAKDAVCVGMFPKYRPDEIRQDAEWTRKSLTG
ncbi:MAG: hypothetical protein C4527_07260 [Candidatus Omnitrophota bacterium]|nr:MAG: hypothetical protein C4527_07260 [Candidatus Omnitrophota bacterium]